MLNLQTFITNAEHQSAENVEKRTSHVFRYREVLTPPAAGGKACPVTAEHRDCSGEMIRCPVDCQMTKWGSCTDCSMTCGKGEAYTMRSVSYLILFYYIPYVGTQECKRHILHEVGDIRFAHKLAV
jgi:hypothetical protein